ncbi:MAG: hypothetical protein HPY61_09210 [Methanotrichaceae archaeon]|nr:hypothetical protein [Methanotrichaceae archaeon]
MPDIAFIGERSFLFEKLFQDLGASYQFLQPSVLGSPFLPQYKMVIIPTGFANPQYSKTLASLQRQKSRLADFVKAGGVLTVFGPVVPEHNFEWLPLPLRYICEYGPRKVEPTEHECSCLLCTITPECDGYLIPGEGFETVLEDERGRAVLVAGKYGRGMIVASSVHEFPASEYILWALSKARPSRM